MDAVCCYAAMAGKFYDHILRSDESTQRAVRYVLENPVRAKLVIEPADYPHSGSLVFDRKALIEWAFGPKKIGGV